MRKFYLLFVLGIAALTAGCGEKNSQTSPMMPNEQFGAGKEITISLNGQAPSVTEVTPAGTAVPTSATIAQVGEMPMDAAAPVAETPTNQQIQQALKNAGLYEGAIDGSLGRKSKAAIKAFQEQNGLTADGKVGKKTWAKLISYLNATPTAAASTEPSN